MPDIPDVAKHGSETWKREERHNRRKIMA